MINTLEGIYDSWNKIDFPALQKNLHAHSLQIKDSLFALLGERKALIDKTRGKRKFIGRN